MQHFIKIRNYLNDAPKGIRICQMHLTSLWWDLWEEKITKCQLKVANISRYDIENMQDHFPNVMISFDVDSTLCRNDISWDLTYFCISQQ